MQLRVTVDGKVYRVEVEMIGEDGGGSVLVPEGAIGATSAVPVLPGVERAAPGPVPPEPTWPTHKWMTPQRPGEVPAPVAGVVLELKVKVGDMIRANDAIAIIEVSKSVATGERAVVGQVRTTAAGTVRDVLVRAGDRVTPGQVLARVG